MRPRLCGDCERSRRRRSSRSIPRGMSWSAATSRSSGSSRAPAPSSKTMGWSGFMPHPTARTVPGLPWRDGSIPNREGMGWRSWPLPTDIDGLEFTPDSRRLVASHPLAISLWDVATGVQVRDPIAGTRRRASLSPDGSRIAYQTSNAIVVESLETGATFRRLKADGTDFFPTGVDIPRLEPVDIAFLEDTALVVFFRRVDRNTGDAVGAVVMLDLQAMTGVWRDRSLMDLSRPIGEYTEAYDTARPPVIPGFGLSPSGRRLFSLTSDGIIRVW